MSEKLPHETSLADNEVKESPSPPNGAKDRELGQDVEVGQQGPAKLTRGLQGRHMQMIAIGK